MHCTLINVLKKYIYKIYVRIFSILFLKYFLVKYLPNSSCATQRFPTLIFVWLDCFKFCCFGASAISYSTIIIIEKLHGPKINIFWDTFIPLISSILFYTHNSKTCTCYLKNDLSVRREGKSSFNIIFLLIQKI